MKNSIVLKVITTVLILSIIFSLFSCMNEDRIEVPPVKLEDINGNYKGRLITVQGEFRSEKVVDFKIKKDTLTFPEFPLKEIVMAVVKDPVKTQEALTKMGKVKYNLNYTTVLNADKNWVELTFAPKELELQIPVAERILCRYGSYNEICFGGRKNNRKWNRTESFRGN
jgi:hypothetical protein